MPRNYQLYIEDMKKSCEKILRYTADFDFEKFRKDELVYDAVLRNLEIIGEAAKNIPNDIRNSFPNVEWRKVSALRDVISHAYFGLDDVILWEIIQTKIPELHKSLKNQ